MLKGTCRWLRPTRTVLPEPCAHSRDGSHGWCAQGRILLVAGCVSGQTRAGSGSWGLFSEVLSHTWGSLLLYLFFPVPVVAPSVAKSGKKADEKLSWWWEHSLLPFALLSDPRHICQHGPFCSSLEQL